MVVKKEDEPNMFENELIKETPKERSEKAYSRAGSSSSL